MSLQRRSKLISNILAFTWGKVPRCPPIIGPNDRLIGRRMVPIAEAASPVKSNVLYSVGYNVGDKRNLGLGYSWFNTF